MSSIQTMHFSWLPQQSAWNQLQAQRAQRRADNQNLLAYSAALASSFNDAMTNQYAGIANLAADAAAKRLGIALPSGAGAANTSGDASKSSTSASNPSASSTDPVAGMNDYLNNLDQILNGTADVVSNAQSAISSAGSAQAALANMIDGANIGGNASATVSQIINGTAGLASSAKNKISADGNMFTTIDRIINSTVTPSSVNVTA
jgi:hypothetical protein